MAFADAQEGTVTLADPGAHSLDELHEFDRATLEAPRHTARLLDTSAQRIPRAAMSPAESGGRIVEPATAEDF
jgi:hypothetical protein